MGKILEVHPSSTDEKERLIAATVTVFPQFKALLDRIIADQPLKKRSNNPDDTFLPKWHISAIIIERFLDCEVIIKDESRKCGYRTEYADIYVNFATETDRTILAKGASMYAANIEESITDADNIENTLFIYFENLFTRVGHQEFFKKLRSIDRELRESSAKSRKDDSILRISLIAKIFPKKTDSDSDSKDGE